ncbi:hypothetical protein [Flavobacterium sp.]|uniref:hypothetical protein n=1 Tax=Flavobacterium sp. TaxID=239 RepID=UPI002635FDCB|nr:hypothetical protein [Flavobacterium sp.]
MNQIKTFLGVLFFFFSCVSYSQVVTQEEFKKEAASFGLNFTMPEGYNAVEIIKNPDLNYSFAMLNKEGKMQVRYSIFPIKKEADNKDSQYKTIASANLNAMYEHLTIATVANLSKGQISEINPFPKEAVMKEFNADYGSTTTFRPDSNYGKGYNVALLITLHKENVADVIIVMLANYEKSDDFYNAMLIPFHALTFK